MLNIECQVPLNHFGLANLYNQKMTLGKRIKKIRKQYKLSQERFGEICDVSKGLVSQWENDVLTPPTDRLLSLREKLEFSFDWLLTGKIEYLSVLRSTETNTLRVQEPPPSDEVDLLLGYRAASQDAREIMLDAARRAIEKQNFTKRNEIQ
ncbi:MAG: helix-turn-helix domain-containing protein [Sulfuricella denitrificans]|nr:helix-turn-helix domain-containing protein [Sulfuricella denitrificans]